MPKRWKRSEHPNAWSWLCHLAAAEGIDLQRMSLAEAADRAVSQLERQQDAGRPLRPETVQFAALLVRLEEEMVASGATSAEPLIERAYARDRARVLAERHAAGQRVWTRPEILPPELEEAEPESEPTVTLYDLIRTCESLMQYVKQRQASPKPIVPAPLSRNNSGSVAQIMVPVAAIKEVTKPIPFFRRRDIEALFGLKKRQAVNLLHRIGAVRVSRELAVEQRDLVCWLERMLSDPSVAVEQRRHEAVIDRIIELKAETAARAVKIVLPDRAPSADLPDGVSLQPGLLTVSFETEQQLLERLFLLARRLATQPQILSSLSLPR